VEMGHQQPPTPIHCDNSTTVGITNNSFKNHQSRPMEMRYFYSVDKARKLLFLSVQYHLRLEILGDYPSKRHMTSHHVNVRPMYLHMEGSLEFCPQAPKTSDLWGRIGKNIDRYKRGRPLPVIPRIRSRLLHGTTIRKIPRGGMPSQQRTQFSTPP
jgi:hypothetical protein